MKHLTKVFVASIHYSIECSNPIQDNSLERGNAYRNFFSPGYQFKDDLSSIIHLRLENTPDTSKMSKIFNSGYTWSMYQKGEEYFLALDLPHFQKSPVWIAQAKRDFSHVTVYCGGSLTRNHDGVISVLNPFYYPLDQLLLMFYLSSRNGALFHAAGVNFHGRGFLFPGRSGAGKSTLSRQFLGREGVEVLSDDRIIVRRVQDNLRAFGTPWPGELGIAVNKSVPLSAIFFIHHGSQNKIEEITPQQAFKRLLPVTSIPWFDPEPMIQILDFCEKIVITIPAFDLHFRPDMEVVKVLEDFALK